MARQTEIETRRLFQAADVLLEALESPEGREGLIAMHRGGGEAAAIGAFTNEELVEAIAMLVRLGLVRERRV